MQNFQKWVGEPSPDSSTTGTNGHSGQLTAKAIGDNKYILSVNDADMEKWDFNVFQVHETSCSDTYKVVSGDYLLDASTWKPGIYIMGQGTGSGDGSLTHSD